MHGVQRCGLLLPMFRGLCVCLLDTTMIHTKTAEPIEMLFGLWTRMGPRNYVLGWARIPPPEEGAILRVVPPLKYIGVSNQETPQQHGAADMSAEDSDRGESAASEWTRPSRG